MYPIIFIGPNKTGTTWIANTLRTSYGLDVTHSITDFGKATNLINQNEDKKLKDHLNNHQAWLDGHWYRISPKIKTIHPQATIVYQTRDYEKWLTSRTAHILKNRIIGLTDWTQINYDQWLQEWNTIRLVAQAHRAITIDVTGETKNPGLKWLTKKLELTQLAPHQQRTNTMEHQIEAILNHIASSKLNNSNFIV